MKIKIINKILKILMSFIDEFLDFTAMLPRDVIRLLKLIKEVDEKSVETNKKLSDSRKLYLSKQKSNELELNNLYLVRMDARLVEDIFDKEIDLIYLNFSDPWPKDRHAKRRLTSPRFLARYDKIFKKDKNIIMKTDNKPLFDYSVESLKEYGYTINYLTNDLHSSKENIITTEYEDKFTSQGLKINYLEASKKGDNHESI